MANYSFVINSTYDPFTLGELMTPYQEYGKAFEKQEDKIEDMTDKAETLKYIAEQDPNSETARLYQSMNDRLTAARDELYRNGMSMGIRKDIQNLRGLYTANASEITRRYNDLREYRDRMTKLVDKDPSVRFTPSSYNIGLDSFAGGKTPSMDRMSGDEVAQRGAQAMKAFTSREFRNSVEGKLMGGQYWNYVQENGMDNNAINELLSHLGDERFTTLNSVIDGIRREYVGKFDDADSQYFDSRLREGLNAGAIYDRRESPTGNQAYISPLEAAREERYKEQADMEKEALKFQRGDGTRIMRGADGKDYRVRVNIDGSLSAVEVAPTDTEVTDASKNKIYKDAFGDSFIYEGNDPTKGRLYNTGGDTPVSDITIANPDEASKGKNPLLTSPVNPAKITLIGKDRPYYNSRGEEINWKQQDNEIQIPLKVGSDDYQRAVRANPDRENAERYIYYRIAGSEKQEKQRQKQIEKGVEPDDIYVRVPNPNYDRDVQQAGSGQPTPVNPPVGRGSEG